MPAVVGRRDTLRLDTSRFGCRQLADELAQEWVDFAAVARPHHATVYSYRQALVDLCTFVDTMAGAEAEACSLAREAPDVSKYIRSWLRTLPSRWPEGSTRPTNLAQFALVLIRLRGQHDARPLSAPVQRLTALTGLTAGGSASELDEFSRADKRALVRAAWTEVRLLEERLAAGRELVTAGSNPHQHGWIAPENLAWGLATNTVTPLEIVRNLPRQALRSSELRRIGELAGLQRTNTRSWVGALSSLLYPTNLDLHAFRVLLVAATGYTPEEVSGLAVDDIEYIPGGVRLRMVKRRGRVVRSREFRDVTATAHAALPDRARLNASEILRRLEAATAEARSRSGRKPDYLFTCAAVSQSGEPVFRKFHSGAHGHDLAAWMRRARVQVQGKLDLRRLRKSVKVEKAIAFRGAVSDVADDHTEQTFFGHYAHGTTLRVLSGHAITRAQQIWLDKALAGPVVLDKAAVKALKEPDALVSLGLTAAKAEDIRQGELDMGVTSCRDPYDSPYSAQGELCVVGPLRCLECRNAFILPSNLPQLLLFADHLEDLRKRLSPRHFHHLWGQQHTNLNAVLAEHSAADLRRAWRQIAEQEVRLQLPLAAFVEFDT